jgi:hypothetical protein
MESQGEMILTGKTEELGKKQSESHFVHINLTWTNAGANPDTGSERQAPETQAAMQHRPSPLSYVPGTHLPVSRRMKKLF